MRLTRCGVFLTLCCFTVAAQQDDTSGFTNRQLEAALKSTGLSGQRLYSLQTFGTQDAAYLAVLSSYASGWRVSVFRRANGGFALEWASHKLPTEFSVSSAGNFSLYDIGEETTVTFSGCAPHRCAGDYEGFLLYSTAKKEAFFALLTQQENQARQVTFSKNALDPRNARYKEALQKAADDMIHRTDLSH